ncbi:MAG TPA: Rieske (2Fe-2S) protein [Acidimicrobiia bacterium]|nr:Rieske (2Fe-2S) protein [Acidimicrobiia bacterium]
MSEEPIWRRDFPYTAAGEEGVTRREFTRFLVAASVTAAGTGGAAALWASLRRINRGEPQEIVALSEVPVGGSHLFDYPTPNDPAILLRPEEGTLLGFSQKCTHLGCVVYWAPENGHLECPCHEGVFDLSGEPIAGPPDRPLGRIEVEVRDGTVWALGAGTEATA